MMSATTEPKTATGDASHTLQTTATGVMHRSAVSDGGDGTSSATAATTHRVQPQIMSVTATGVDAESASDCHGATATKIHATAAIPTMTRAGDKKERTVTLIACPKEGQIVTSTVREGCVCAATNVDGRRQMKGGVMDELHTQLKPGATFGVGSLPHRSMADAIDFVWSSTDIPTIPSLPRRSPSEGMIAQALVGIEGVSVGQYGGISVDIAHLDVDQFITTDVSSDAYGAFEYFLSTFAERTNGTDVVKWQFVGPVTLGAQLLRAGLNASIAFPLALQAVRAHVLALEEAVAHACGDITQIIMLDEPSLAEALEPGYVIGVEHVIDLISGALATVEQRHIGGVHCCAPTHWNALLATGAHVLSVPVPSVNDEIAMSEMLVAASRISDLLERGGRIAWGAVRTDGPIAMSAERSWKSIVEVMCALVKAGVDPVLLRRQSFVTPACGLGTHSEGVAQRVFAHTRDVSIKVAEQATASRLTLGS